jgi:uncharacterized membrane protein YhhN
MMGGIILCALAIIMAIIVIFVLHPIWAGRGDIPWPVLVYFLIIMPLGSLALYLWLGRPELLALF